MSKTVFTWCVLSTAWVLVAWNWGRMEIAIPEKAAKVWGHEKAALELASENRLLQSKLADLEFKLGKIETEKHALAALVEGKKQASRSIASVPKAESEDLVNYDVYQWTPEKLLAIGEKELHFKNYAKSAQFFNELVTRFPNHAVVNDRALFGAGIAAFEAKEHEWAIKHFGKLTEKYPKSHFHRGAKLWQALAQYKTGNYRMFASTVEEFRLKYRNTEEWKILSKYYEDINYTFKQ
jgi:tetratricopeptide (TPR) repeat protein